MPHNCLQCAKEIPRKPHESVNRYNGKKYCSTTCAKAYMKENKVGWFSPEMQTIKRPKLPSYEVYPSQATDY